MLLMPACKVQHFMLEVYTPAPLDLPPELRTLVAVSRFVPATGPYDEVQWGHYQSFDSTLFRLANESLLGFTDEMNSSGRFGVRTPQGVRMLRHNGDSLPEMLPWEGLVQICRTNLSDGIALLEGFSIQQEPMETKEVSNQYVTTQMVHVKLAWRVLQPNRRRILDAGVYSYSKQFEGRGESRQAALDSLPDKGLQLLQAARYAGTAYANSMKPGLIAVKRNFYQKGHPVLEETAPFVLTGEWGKVEQKWKKNAYEGDSDELKAMCSYNMALLSEKQGFLNQALGYARRAQRFMPSKVHLDYINELTTRELQQEDQLKAGAFVRNW